MGTIRRWTAGFVSRLDSAVSQLENHEARVTAAIRDAREARARAKVQLARVRRDGYRMEQRVAALREAEGVWRERAQRCAGDEARALECLRRRRRAAREREELERQLAEHARVRGQLGRDLARIDERVGCLERQRNVLRTRESRADALAAARPDDGALTAEIDELFERWEIKVARVEIGADCEVADDDLEDELAREEETGSLRAELAELLRETDAEGAPR